MTRKRIHIGPMRERVVIQSMPDPADIEVDAVGGRVSDWQTVGVEVWANVRPSSAYERQAYAHDTGGVSHVVTMRHPGYMLTNSHRLVYDGRVLEVRGSIDPDERGRFLIVQADENVSGGGGDE